MEANTVAMEAAREFLGRAQALRREIENKERRIQTLRDMAESTTGKMSDMPRSDSPNLQRMETVLCKAADLEMEVAEDQARLDGIKEEITAALGELTDYREQEILYYRYVGCMSWSGIMAECGFSRRTILRRNQEGIEHLAAIQAGNAGTAMAHP